MCAWVVYASDRPRNALYVLQIVSYAEAMSDSLNIIRPFLALRFGLIIAVACLSLFVLSAPAHAASAASGIDAQHPVGTAWSEAPRTAPDRTAPFSESGTVGAAQVRPVGTLPFTGVDAQLMLLLTAVGGSCVVAGSLLVMCVRSEA